VSDGSSGTCSSGGGSSSSSTCSSGSGSGGGVRKGPVQCVVYDNCQVLPGDIDRNMHMSNDKYLYHLNFARKRFFGQAGVWEYLWRRGDGWNLVVTSQSIRYRKELRLWQRYRVEVRLVGWSDKDKSFYLESCFITGEGESVFVHAVHWVKYRLLGKDNSGNEAAMPSSVLSACSSNEGDGGRADSDNLPVVNGLQNADAEHFRLWNEANAFSSARMRSRTHDSKTSR
jgi:acyl-CoA thioesterase FadM